MFKQISDIGIVPVIKMQDPQKAVPLANALIKGGLPIAEVTFRTKCAGEAIANIAQNFPDMLVGAGTVLTVEQAQKAVDAGAKFIVSPGFNPKIVQWCLDHDVVIVPGISTPSEIELALEMGLKTVKFFPAEQSGGVAKIKAMAAPYGDVTFMPTGGISLDNLNDYLSFPKILACGGSFMVKESLIENEQWEEITSLCKQAVKQMLGFSLAHIGINEQSEESALKTASFFCDLLGIEQKNGNSSVFAGSMIEVMKSPYLGKNGHIAIQTNSVDRAVYHLGAQGIKFRQDSAKYDDKGKLKAIYLQDEIGGFAVHLVQK